MALHNDLPPLLALRAFEAVARHLSFIKAANELSVTQSALSHQVQKLEQYLDKPLFIRRTRAIDLNAERAKRVHDLNDKRLNEVRQAFEQAMPLGKPKKKPKNKPKKR